jgi:uncharacterized zinc-type alcohol dehydrogenase-like protein
MALYDTFAFAKVTRESPYSKITIKRNEPGPDDVQFKVLYCGICHTDVHYANNDMGNSKWPLVPGHELAGEVTAVGSKVMSVVPGDCVGVGCIVDSCMTCKLCNAGEENYCENGMTMTYSSDIKHGHIATDTGFTYGGYSGSYTVHQKYIIR